MAAWLGKVAPRPRHDLNAQWWGSEHTSMAHLYLGAARSLTMKHSVDLTHLTVTKALALPAEPLGHLRPEGSCLQAVASLLQGTWGKPFTAAREANQSDADGNGTPLKLLQLHRSAHPIFFLILKRPKKT